MKRTAFSLILALLLVGARASKSGEQARPGAERTGSRELVFSYDGNELRINRVTPIPGMLKKTRSPNAQDASVPAPYLLEWRDAVGRVLHTAAIRLPVGVRVPLPEAGRPDGTEGVIVPETGHFLVRTTGPVSPFQPATIRMVRQPGTSFTKTAPGGSAFPDFPSDMAFTLSDLPQPSPGKGAGLRGCVKLRDTGPDGNRLVLVVMGDGFTASDLSAGTYSSAVDAYLAKLQAIPPFDSLWGGVNVYRIDIESQEGGADYEDSSPPGGTLKDTYLDASFWWGGGGIERLLYVDSGKAMDAANTMVGTGMWDEIIVLVNSPKYGGGGGDLAVSSLNALGAEVTAHEFGHSFGLVADEYEYGGEATYTGANPMSPNVDISPDHPKWMDWIEAGTPLPTPDSAAYDSVVGAFQGANYSLYGIYRPCRSCKMRAIGYPFCPICKEALLRSYFGLVDFADYASPGTGSLIQVITRTNLVLGVIPVTGMTVQWELNGHPVGAGGSTFEVAEEELPLPVNTLDAAVRFDSDLLRGYTAEQVFSWRLSNPTPVVLPPRSIGATRFTARWKWAEGGFPEGELSVSRSSDFLRLVPGYEACHIVNQAQGAVTNLLADKDYWYRVRRWGADGRPGRWSAAMKVRTGVGMPAFPGLLSEAPVSKSVIQEFRLANLVSGTGTLKVKSSDVRAVKPVLTGDSLTLQCLWAATNAATLTMTLSHPQTGYQTTYRATLTQAKGSVAVVGQSGVSNLGARLIQDVTLRNRTGAMVYGVRVKALGLEKPTWMINRTGLDPATGAAIREIPCILPANAQMVVRLIFDQAYRAQAAPVAYKAWAIITPEMGARPENAEMTITQWTLDERAPLLGLPVNRNRLYAIYHSDDGGAVWKVNKPLIRATGQFLMWMEGDEGAPANRMYRVLDAGL